MIHREMKLRVPTLRAITLRVIDVFVDELDLRELGFDRAELT